MEEPFGNRRKFIAKASLMALALLLLTSLQLLPVMLMPQLCKLFHDNVLLIFIPIIIYVMIMVLVSFFPEIQHTKPYNIIILVFVVGSLSVVLQILTAYYGEFFFLIAVAVAIFIYGSISSISSCFEANWRCLKVSLTILTFATGIYLGVAVAISYFVSLKIIVVSTAAVCLLTFSANQHFIIDIMDTFGTNAKFEAPAFSKSKAVYSSELAIPIETQTDHNTIKQVFITKLIFLLPTIIQAIPLMLVEDSRMYLKDNSSMVYFALVLYASATLIFTFLPNMQNRNPYTIVSAFVMIESLTAIIAFISSYYQGIVVLTSFGAAVIACVSLAALGIYCTVFIGGFL
ncbi:unnamed protein product [Hermetia illucens]|uniref:Uncharacterized protein n=1 Tax=Hermetia illucens TaxID=343691 RepID=A0A7R8UAK8_HERIL|nr:unnamed protein product [Hermetia illucens]